MSFTNNPVDPETLPRFEAVELVRLSPRYAPLVLVTSIVAWSVLALGIIIAGVVLDGLGEVIFSSGALRFFSVGAAVIAFLIWFMWKTASVIRYAVRDEDVIVRTGIFWRKETIQPIARIQHVEQTQGPLEKRFGLYTLKLFSAGTGHVTFQIPGLAARTAARIKRFLLDKSRSRNATHQVREQ